MYILFRFFLPPTQIFAANVDKDTERFHYLNQPFVARFVRLYPLAWNAHMSMRAGVLGCPFVADCGPGFMRINPVSPCGQSSVPCYFNSLHTLFYERLFFFVTISSLVLCCALTAAHVSGRTEASFFQCLLPGK